LLLVSVAMLLLWGFSVRQQPEQPTPPSKEAEANV
jgi:hypothetical protein